jgi:hypothetical protein
MGYIPPLHYSAYHHYAAQKNIVQAPFMFTKVPKIKYTKENQETHYIKAIKNYRINQSELINNELSTQKLISELTGIGRVINILI